MNLLPKALIIYLLSFGSSSLIFSIDFEECENLNESDCLIAEACEWEEEDENCNTIEDDEEDEYTYEASAEFEFDESDIYFGKIRLKITETNVNKLIFSLERLEEVTSYSIQLDELSEFPFTTNSEGKFEWEMRSDSEGDAPLPQELIPLSQFNIAQLMDTQGNLVAAAVFDSDDEGCTDLPQFICDAVPLCTWHEIQGCQENNWDFDDDDGDGISDDDDDDDDDDGIPDDEDDDDDDDGIPDDEDNINGPWDLGEYFADEMIEAYSQYMDHYNQTGEGLFNYITINPLREETLNADIGDEIGVLDYSGQQNGAGCDDVIGNQLVGAGIWKGDPLTIFTFGHYSNCNTGGTHFPGFIPGNTIIIRVYKPALDQFIDYDAMITWGNSRSSFELSLTSMIGDVNNDGSLDVTDVVLIVDMVLGYSELDITGDVNGDALLNVLDIVDLVNLILGIN